jgi:DNA-binding response OmpR family regulator
MQKFILAVSPDAKLLMQVQAHLQEGGRFSVVCVGSGKDALAALQAENFDIAILDAEISDLPFVTLTRELVALSPNLKLLVFPPQNNPRHPVLNGLLANGFVNKPFFGPEVSERIAKALNERPRSDSTPAPQELDMARNWIKYPEIGAQQIEQLLASTTALAGLLLLHGQVLASSGVLTQESSGNIINYLNRYWTNIQSGELFRYLTMEHEATSCIIYAAPLIKDTAIGLVYNAQKPLPEIRNEVTRLRKAFLERYSNTRELRQDFPGKDQEQTAPIVDEPPPPPVKRLNTHRLDEIPTPESDDEEMEGGEGLSPDELQNLSNILAEMPSPDPEEGSLGNAEAAFDSSTYWTTSGLADLDSAVAETPTHTPSPVEAMGFTSKPEDVTAEPSRRTEEEFPNFDFKLPWEDPSAVGGARPEATIAAPPAMPAIPSESAYTGYAEQETVPSSAYRPMPLVPFTFLIFPADPSQFITRDLAVLCNQQLPKILTGFGWQLSAISVRPLYLQWSALIPPLNPIPEKLADIQLQLNMLFFNNFPELLQNNPEGEFWLSGYMALSGTLPPSNRMINDFIAFYRQTEPQLRSN